MTSKPRSVKKLPATDNELSSGSTISEKKGKITSTENPQVQEGWRSCNQGSESNLNFWWVYKPSRISIACVADALNLLYIASAN